MRQVVVIASCGLNSFAAVYSVSDKTRVMSSISCPYALSQLGHVTACTSLAAADSIHMLSALESGATTYPVAVHHGLCLLGSLVGSLINTAVDDGFLFLSENVSHKADSPSVTNTVMFISGG